MRSKTRKIAGTLSVVLVLLTALSYAGFLVYWWPNQETREHVMYATWNPATLPHDNRYLAPFRRHASIQYLRFKDYDPNVILPPGVTVLQFTLNEYGAAKGRGDTAAKRVLLVAGILVERGADIDAHGTMLGDTALHNAVLYNEPAVVEFLLETGAGTGITIIRPGHVWHGLTAAGLASWLNDNADRRKSDWSEIETILVNETDLGGDRAEP